MILVRPASASAAILAALIFAGTASAADVSDFVVMLGRDTLSVEHDERAADKLEGHQVGRAPRVLRRHYTYDLADGVPTRFKMVVTPVGSETPTQTIDAAFDGDSLRLHVQTGSAPVTNSALAMPRGTLLVPFSSPWSVYEGQTLMLARTKADTVGAPMYLLGAQNTTWLTVRKLGKDSVEVFNGNDRFRARVDAKGHILGTRPLAGTNKYTVIRPAKLDLEAMAAAFDAREKAGAGLGVLSPRDTVDASAGGATLWIDYGRPSRRGRPVFGGIVPYGEVWRTGANAATQFKTDKDLDFGGVVVPAGFYTLWTMPTAEGWKLIVNGETGQWGTEHKAAKDLYTIDMKVSALPVPVERFRIGVVPATQGGVIDLDWDTTRAAAAFTVKP